MKGGGTESEGERSCESGYTESQMLQPLSGNPVCKNGHLRQTGSVSGGKRQILGRLSMQTRFPLCRLCTHARIDVDNDGTMQRIACSERVHAHTHACAETCRKALCGVWTICYEVDGEQHEANVWLEVSLLCVTEHTGYSLCLPLPRWMRALPRLFPPLFNARSAGPCGRSF